VGDDGLIGAILDVHQPLFEGEFDVLAPGLSNNFFVERGAGHVHRGLTEALLHVAVDRAQPRAGLRIEIEGFGNRAAADHLVGEADFGQYMHAVRRDLQPAANAGRVGPRFKHPRVDTGSFEKDGGHRTGNAGADDDGFAGWFGHALLLTSVKWYEIAATNYLSI